ncbi:uncharacterized protein V6R79_009818 [Siganus canaliculatus]
MFCENVQMSLSAGVDVCRTEITEQKRDIAEIYFQNLFMFRGQKQETVSALSGSSASELRRSVFPSFAAVFLKPSLTSTHWNFYEIHWIGTRPERNERGGCFQNSVAFVSEETEKGRGEGGSSLLSVRGRIMSALRGHCQVGFYDRRSSKAAKATAGTASKSPVKRRCCRAVPPPFSGSQGRPLGLRPLDTLSAASFSRKPPIFFPPPPRAVAAEPRQRQGLSTTQLNRFIIINSQRCYRFTITTDTAAAFFTYTSTPAQISPRHGSRAFASGCFPSSLPSSPSSTGPGSSSALVLLLTVVKRHSLSVRRTQRKRHRLLLTALTSTLCAFQPDAASKIRRKEPESHSSQAMTAIITQQQRPGRRSDTRRHTFTWNPPLRPCSGRAENRSASDPSTAPKSDRVKGQNTDAWSLVTVYDAGSEVK